MLRAAVLCALSVVLAAGAPGRPGGAEELTIGTGSKVGVYYQVGRTICALMNRRRAETGLICKALSTAGSIANLKAVREGTRSLGVAQSDWQYHAVRGSKAFKDAGADASLRALFSVHGEPFTVVALQESGIRTLRDLKGRRVNIGNPGSGQRATMEVVMEAMGWTKRDFILAEELPASQQSLALCHERIDAMIYTVGHPNASVRHATDLCDGMVVEVAEPEIDGLVADHSYYSYTTVPGGAYGNNPEPVKTFGVKATVVASAELGEELVYTLVQTVFDNFDRFKRGHPAFAGLEPEKMLRDGLSAPLHEGALRYYRERGWVKDPPESG